MSGPLVAEFRDPEALRQALGRVKEARHLALDAFTPYPIEGLDEQLAVGPSGIRYAMLVGGLIVAALAFGLQWYSAVIDYPLNVGGRPLNSWQVFLLVPFEVGVLAAALCGVDRVPVVVRSAAPASSAIRNSRFRARDAGSFLLCSRRPNRTMRRHAICVMFWRARARWS